MSEDLTALSAADLEARLDEVRTRMRPLEQDLDDLRAQRDQVLTELRRRERLAQREGRTAARDAIRSGEAASLRELLGAVDEGPFEAYSYRLKTGGEVRLGFPGARAQTIAWTDGRQLAQARDFAECARLYQAGWEPGAPGKPGVRVHFAGTRQERLADPAELFATRT